MPKQTIVNRSKMHFSLVTRCWSLRRSLPPPPLYSGYMYSTMMIMMMMMLMSEMTKAELLPLLPLLKIFVDFQHNLFCHVYANVVRPYAVTGRPLLTVAAVMAYDNK